jgi:hypothetical protein
MAIPSRTAASRPDFSRVSSAAAAFDTKLAATDARPEKLRARSSQRRDAGDPVGGDRCCAAKFDLATMQPQAMSRFEAVLQVCEQTRTCLLPRRHLYSEISAGDFHACCG